MQKVNFKTIVDRYETVFFDAFGVLKNHQGLLPGVLEMFQYLDERKIDYYILTNDASRSPLLLAESYQKYDLKQITEDKIISSGMLATEYLKLKVASGTLAYVGTELSAHYLEDLGLHAISIADVDLTLSEDIGALVFLDDEGFDWSNDVNKCVNLLRQRNIPVIVSNTDRSYPTSGKEVAIAVGALANMVEQIVGKKFIKFGKPDAQMFIFAYEHAVGQGGTVDKNKILMVGDTLLTDILGGNKFGLDTALVLTGNTLPRDADMGIKALGIIPTHICDSVAI
ncbi:MAG: TIGR01459 family HAD-type hydrolase [Cyclobacteriaceae bacterium]|nr:TIGR01459 family HAD-type hydrolase [Cyclobacteriaceae bacterium HetDA_MAG_MS6]